MEWNDESSAGSSSSRLLSWSSSVVCRVAQAARDLDVHENVLRKWVREQAADPQQAFPGHGQMKPEQLEIDRLRREVAKLKAERDILKKAAAYFAREVDMKFGFIAKHRAIWPVAWLCEALDVSRSGFQRLADTDRPSARARADEDAGSEGAGELRRQRPHLWRPPCLAGRSGGRRLAAACTRSNG